MEKEHHEFFNGIVRDFPALSALFSKVAKECDSLRTNLVTYENKLSSLKAQCDKLTADNEAAEKKLREKRVLMGSNEAAVKGELQKMRDELTEREARIMVREKDIATIQARLDNLLIAAEVKVAAEKKAIESKPQTNKRAEPVK